jgi:hypothetical protein
MNAQNPVPPSTEGGTPVPDPDPISDQIKQVRLAATSLLERAEKGSSVPDLAAAVEKAAGALKLAAEMEKARNQRAERVRDYVALLTPMITIIILAATLVTQNWQFLRSERDKREEAMDAQWQDAVKTISASGALSPGVVALQPFLRSAKYREQAHDAAAHVLANSSDPTFFTTLFGTALTPVTWDNVYRLIQLDRGFRARLDPIFAKTFDAAKQANDWNRLSLDERATRNYALNAVPVIASEIGGLLRTPHPPGVHIDLSGTYFNHGDWRGADLSGANLDNIQWNYCSLQNAELGGVTQFSGAILLGTPWWEAKSINRPFLDYLTTNFKLNPGLPYGPSNAKVTQDEYDAAVQRLQSQLK